MKAEELQRAADRNDMKGFYSGLKEVWGPHTKQPVHLNSSDGLEIFTDSMSGMARWSEYFQKLLNVPGNIEPEVLENIQKRSVNTTLGEKPTMDEMVRAIKGLKYGKAPGGDEIEFQQYGNTGELTCPTNCTDGSSKYGRMAMYHKPGRIPTLSPSTKKGDRTECGNYRGISLLSAAGKIFARILLNRLSSHITPEVVPETQCDFRSNRSTVDMIFRKSAKSRIDLCILSLSTSRRHSTPLGGLDYGSY